jgi:hypothetical protein
MEKKDGDVKTGPTLRRRDRADSEEASVRSSLSRLFG